MAEWLIQMNINTHIEIQIIAVGHKSKYLAQNLERSDF